MTFLEAAREELLKEEPLPSQIQIECSEETDNLLVKGSALGFCITGLSIRDGLYKGEYKRLLRELVAAETK